MCNCFQQNNSDAALLLTKNCIKALKNVVFDITRQTFKIEKLMSELRGFSVGLSSILIWAIRENRLHHPSKSNSMLFNLKLDGRPLVGKYFSR